MSSASSPELPLHRTALVVIDMANDFLHAGGVIADAGGAEYQARAQAILPRVAALLAAARASGVKVVYATDAHTPTDLELRKWPPHAMKGTWQAAYPEVIAPQPGDLIFEKRTYSPFIDPAFDERLRALGVERLVITGLHTDCCCRHTSGDAFQRGYDLVWVTDALQAFTEAQHQQGLEYFKAWYATDEARQFRTSAELVEEWSAAGVAA